jgi:hypothetical protein
MFARLLRKLSDFCFDYSRVEVYESMYIQNPESNLNEEETTILPMESHRFNAIKVSNFITHENIFTQNGQVKLMEKKSLAYLNSVWKFYELN